MMENEKNDSLREDYWRNLLASESVSEATGSSELKEVSAQVESHSTDPDASDGVKLALGVAEGRFAGIMKPFDFSYKLQRLLEDDKLYHFEISFLAAEELTE